jgi:hypothetical protein
VSASSEGKNNEDENYELHFDKKLKAGSHVPCKSDHQQHRGKSKLSQTGKNREVSPTLMVDDLDFTDAVLMGLNSLMQTLIGLRTSQIHSILACDGLRQ